MDYRQIVVMKIRDGGSLLASKEKLTADSRIFRYFIEELNQHELEMDDFSPEAVAWFVTVLGDKKWLEIDNSMFRELHKQAKVFEVEWLEERCSSWLRNKMNSGTEDTDKKFAFEECWYILKKWDERNMMDQLVSIFSPQDNKTFISNYMSVFDGLETEQIDLMLKLGGSNTDLFLHTILLNLWDHEDLNENVRHLLQNMNLALCSERNEKLYLDVFEMISNLSEISVTDMRFVLKIMSETTKLVTSRREKRKSGTTVLYDRKTFQDNLSGCRKLDDIIKAVAEDRVLSIYVVLEQLLFLYYKMKKTPNLKEIHLFVTTLEEISIEKNIQKISQYHLNDIISALYYSSLEQSDSIITLLNEIKNSKTLTTNHENVIIKRGELVTVEEGKEYKRLYTFKHPGTGTCPVSGSKCGFILRSSKNDGNWTESLCTNTEDYSDTGIHYHDFICTREMYRYAVYSGDTIDGTRVRVAGRWQWEKKWLRNIKDWAMQPSCIAYNVSSYLVANKEC